MKSKKIIALVLGFVLCVSFSMSAFADAQTSALTIEAANVEVENGFFTDHNGNTINVAALPHFDNKEAAMTYLNSFKSVSGGSNIISSRATNSDVLVQRYSYVFGYTDIRLKYTTSGDNHTGYVTSAIPYTQTGGLTVGTSWEQKTLTAAISGSKKDVEVFCAGEFVYYLVISGVIELARQPVTHCSVIACSH